MRWIDIVLPPRGHNPETDALLVEARRLAATLAAVQEREGLDGFAVGRTMAAVGRLLFRAVLTADPTAFQPRTNAAGAAVPPVGLIEYDGLIGYHFVTDLERVTLPWTWLHSGIGFVLENHPICAGLQASRVPEATPARPWMQRYSEALFAGNGGNGRRRAETGPASPPQILFVPGHGDEAIRRLIFREADGIRDALHAAERSATTMKMPRQGITPQQLAALSFTFQAIHYAGPTSRPPTSAVTDAAWLAELEAGAGSGTDAGVEDLVGLELDVVGVDPVDALLDNVVERYETDAIPREPIGAPQAGGPARTDADRSDRRRAGRSPGISPAATAGAARFDARQWLLDDGPVRPEALGRLGSTPPLIFSNSCQSLPALGPRFLDAGASTFVGPLVPLYSRPARRFAARYYSFLGDGLCAGSALRSAALAVREELGADHPAWLSYGVLGYGSLGLDYL